MSTPTTSSKKYVYRHVVVTHRNDAGGIVYHLADAANAEQAAALEQSIAAYAKTDSAQATFHGTLAATSLTPKQYEERAEAFASIGNAIRTNWCEVAIGYELPRLPKKAVGVSTIARALFRERDVRVEKATTWRYFLVFAGKTHVFTEGTTWTVDCSKIKDGKQVYTEQQLAERIRDTKLTKIGDNGKREDRDLDEEARDLNLVMPAELAGCVNRQSKRTAQRFRDGGDFADKWFVIVAANPKYAQQFAVHADAQLKPEKGSVWVITPSEQEWFDCTCLEEKAPEDASA